MSLDFAYHWLNITQGGYYDVNNGAEDIILKFDDALETWTQVGTLKEPRRDHGVSGIRIEDVMQYAINCTNL